MINEVEIEPNSIITYATRIDNQAMRAKVLKDVFRERVMEPLSIKQINARLASVRIITPSYKVMKDMGAPDTFFDFTPRQLEEFYYRMAEVYEAIVNTISILTKRINIMRTHIDLSMVDKPRST